MARSHYLTQDLNLTIARGLTNAVPVHKFGAVPEMTRNHTGTIWDKDDTLYPWSAFDTAGILVAAQADGDDNGKQVVVMGLDANYNDVTETFTLSSAGTVDGEVVFKRVYRAYMVTGDNVEDVSFTRGGTEVLRIIAGKSQTLMAIYTVPAGYTAYITKGTCTCRANADATGDMFVRYAGQASFRVGHSFEVSGTGGEYTYDFSVPIAIPAKSDIDVRASVRTNNARVTAAFDILLIPN
jgi:hypothetical protein